MKEWSKYAEWLKKTSKPQYDLLNDGASSAEIARLKLAFDFDLPEELFELYKTNNGQAEILYRGTTFIGMSFLYIDNLIGHYKQLKELYYQELNPGETYGDYYDFEKTGAKSFPEKAIKIKYINLKWIPLFFDGGGNYIGVDLDPDEKGSYGQIINFGRDEKEKFVLAKNLRSFFDLINNQIELGNMKCLNAAENGYGDQANFYLMSFDNPLEDDLVRSLIKIIRFNL